MNAQAKEAQIWANLFWKEWREHQWKLAALTAITLGTYLALLPGGPPQDGVLAALLVFTISGPLGALFIGMGLGAKEQATGSVHFLRSLPATPQRAAIAKLLVGLAVALTPGILLITLASVLFHWNALFEWPRDPFEQIPRFLGSGVWQLELVFGYTLTCASLLVWSAVLGMNRSSELRAGAAALVGVIGLWLVVPFVLSWFLPVDPATGLANRVAAYVQVALPGGALYLGAFPEDTAAIYRLTALAVCALVHLLLFWRWISAYGTSTRGATQSPSNEVATSKAWFGAPMASPTRAILWKQVRECLPLAGGVAALGVGWASWIVLSDSGSMSRVPTYERVHYILWLTTMSGFLAALFVGIGGFQDDLNSGLSAFWRSRPIDPNRWFWLKYAGGLATLAGVFGGAYLLAFLLDGEEAVTNSAYPARFLAAFWVTYAVAVLASCTVRNAVYAAILAFVAVGMTVGLALNQEFRLPASAQLLILLAAGAGITLLAWQAMRRDWRFGA